MTTQFRLDLSRRYAEQPKLTRISIASVLLASSVVLFTWARILFLAPGAVVGFVDGGTVLTLSLLAAALGSGLAFLLGSVQMLFISPRRSGLISIGFGLIPVGLLYAMSWYLNHVKKIGFD